MVRSKINPFIMLLAALFLAPGAPAQGSGAETFKATCSACHTVGGGKLVGPDLAGVTERRGEDWLISFIRSSQSMIKAGDPEAVAVFEEYNKTVMPDQPLSDAQAREVLAYLGGGSEGAATAEAAPMPEGDTVRGEALFLGLTRFDARGPSCISCHHIDHKDLTAGGAFAKDLTASHGNLGEAGVQAILKAPPFPSMKRAYEQSPLTMNEVADVTAFLGKVSAEEGLYKKRNAGNSLLYPGLGAVTVLLAFFSLIWVRRRRSTVNQRIYDRQIKSE